MQRIHDEVMAKASSLPTESPATPFEGRGHNLFPLGQEDPQKQIMASTIQLAHSVTNQWITFEGCRPGDLDTISLHTAQALGLRGCKVGEKV